MDAIQAENDRTKRIYIHPPYTSTPIPMLGSSPNLLLLMGGSKGYDEQTSSVVSRYIIISGIAGASEVFEKLCNTLAQSTWIPADKG